MAAEQTDHFGFHKFPGGDMIFGRDMNRMLDNLDLILYDAKYIDHVVAEGAAAAVGVGSAAWAQLVLDNEQEIVFPSEVDLTKARIIVTNAGALAANSVDLALALASAPGTPITTVLAATAAGVDGIVTALPGLASIPADEEIIVIEKDTADVGFGPSAIDLQVAVEADIKFTEE